MPSINKSNAKLKTGIKDKYKKQIKIGALSIISISVAIGTAYYFNTIKSPKSLTTGNSQEAIVVYIAETEIGTLDSFEGKVKSLEVPAYAVPSDYLDNITGLKASQNIKPNTIITSTNSYDPTTQGQLDLGQEVLVEFPGADQLEHGSFIDLHLKRYNKNSWYSTYADGVVLTKKQVIKTETNQVKLILNQVELNKLNCALIELNTSLMGNSDTVVTLYPTVYTDPNNQASSEVTYRPSSHIDYTKQSIDKSTEGIDAKIEVNENQVQDISNNQVLDVTKDSGFVILEEEDEANDIQNK